MYSRLEHTLTNRQPGCARDAQEAGCMDPFLYREYNGGIDDQIGLLF